MLKKRVKVDSFLYGCSYSTGNYKWITIKRSDVLTAREDNATHLQDEELLERASKLNRVLFTFDKDLLTVSTKFISESKSFTGLVFTHPTNITIGNCVLDLEIIANVLS